MASSHSPMCAGAWPTPPTALGTASHVLIVAHGGVFWALQHLCRAPFTPLGNCRPAHVAPVGETSWRIEMLTLQASEA
jgi:hypothetical protein